MSLYRKLNAIVGRYKSDLLLIREFVTSTLEDLDDLGKIFEQQKGKLTSEDLEALLAVGEALKEVANDKKHRILSRDGSIVYHFLSGRFYEGLSLRRRSTTVLSYSRVARICLSKMQSDLLLSPP